jgi:SAM-dependent methyltransferase
MSSDVRRLLTTGGETTGSFPGRAVFSAARPVIKIRANELTMSANLLLHSLSNFREIILPVLELAGVRRIVEVGSEYGTFTQDLFAYATKVGGQFTSIDPAPQPAARQFIDANATNPHFQFVEATSVEALPRLAAADAYIIDGDHNYFTVRKELELVAAACAGKPLLVFQHDVCWPCARRDMYYNPALIPDLFRQPYTMREGITLDNPGTIPGGFRGEGAFGIALREGGEANGVHTAIEDFVAEHPELRYEIIPAIFGLGIVFSQGAPWAEPAAALLRPYVQNPLLARLERNRLELYLKVIELQDRLAVLPTVPPPASKPVLQAPSLFNQMPSE